MTYLRRWAGLVSLVSRSRSFESGDFISGWCECLSEACCAKDLDDAFEVVSHDGDADFRLSTRQASQQQTRMPEDAIFDRSEGMLNGRSSQPYGRWRRARVHAVECIATR